MEFLQNTKAKDQGKELRTKEPTNINKVTASLSRSLTNSISNTELLSPPLHDLQVIFGTATIKQHIFRSVERGVQRVPQVPCPDFSGGPEILEIPHAMFIER